MAQGIKEYPPTDLKLSRLRSAGIVPFSRELLTFAVVISVPVAIGFASRDSELLDWSRQMLHEPGSPEEFVERLWVGARLFFRLAVVTTAAIAAAVFLVGAVQNRFLFAFSALGFSFSRLFSLDGSYISELFFRVLSAVAQTLLVFLLVFMGVTLVRYYVAPVESNPLTVYDAASLEKELGVASRWAQTELFELVIISSIAALLLGIVSRLCNVAIFHRRHRMTRAEVEAEFREMEMAPEFRSARRDMFTE